jgi:1-phosphofructokinase family hexose kinase
MILTVTLNTAMDKTLEVRNFQVGRHVEAEVKNLVPAGKGINVARGVCKLGGTATACGFVGSAERSIYEDSLRKDGVIPVFTEVKGVTRTNVTILDPVAGSTTHLREDGFRVLPQDINRLKMSLRMSLQDGDFGYVVFSGSLPPGIGEEEFIDLLVFCRGYARIIVDTSGGALDAACRSGAVDAIKPNLDELESCVIGIDVDKDDVCRCARLLLDRFGFEYVLVTAGADGAYFIGWQDVFGIRCEVPPTSVCNTVGCGDAFLAGWLCEITAGKAPIEALKTATAAGTASACGENAVDYDAGAVEKLKASCRQIRW